MKIILMVFFASVIVCGFALWWVFIEGYPFSKEAFLAIINMLSILFAAMFTHIRTTESDEKKFRRELLDKFLDSSGHWAYYTSTLEKDKAAHQKSREDYWIGLRARYHRIQAGIEDQSEAEEFGRLFAEFTKIASIQSEPLSSEDEKQIGEAIQRMTDFLRRHYLK